MIERVAAAEPVRTETSSRKLLAGATALALVVATGCDSSIGPVHLQIQTGGVRFDDFVIEPTQEYGRIHGSKMVSMDALVVASEEELTLPTFSTGWTFTTLLVSAYHPEFLYVWTGEAKTAFGEMTLPPLKPQRLVDYLEEHGKISLRMVEAHLDRILLSYVPVFESAESRKRLRRYLPSLRDLVQRASWQSRPSSHWATEADARADLQETLRAISESMQ
jgi:hypothetical protein